MDMREAMRVIARRATIAADALLCRNHSAMVFGRPSGIVSAPRTETTMRDWRRESSLDWFRRRWPCQWLPCLTWQGQFKFMDAITTTLTT